MQNKPALSPSAINKYLKTLMEGDKYLKYCAVKGEISNLKYHNNGNIYFNIKDEGAAINCVMFKSYAAKLEDKFSEGDKVEIEASIYLYVKGGYYNLNVFQMQKVGLGDLFQKYEQLKKELTIKGYFKDEIKKSLPKFPQKICIITSPTGAAVQDMITTIKRRYPICKINILPTLVQGSSGAKSISENIQRADADKLGDVIIVGRGGGSIEDLWNFNELEVVEAIFKCQTPIISSVGHETDFTLADFVSDVRAATPTAAAELATPDIEELKKECQEYREKLIQGLEQKVKTKKLELEVLSENQYLKNPLMKVNMEFDNLSRDFEGSKNLFNLRVQTEKKLLSTLHNEISIHVKQHIKNEYLKLEREKQLLDELNPLTILSKGYSVSKVKNKIVKSTRDVKVGNIMETAFKDGMVISEIMEVKNV